MGQEEQTLVHLRWARFLRGPTRLRRALHIGVGAAAVTLALAYPATSHASNPGGPPTMTHHVQPTYSTENYNGCPSGTTTFISNSADIDNTTTLTYSHNGTTFMVTVYQSGKLLRFTTNAPSFTVYVRRELPSQDSSGDAPGPSGDAPSDEDDQIVWDLYKYTGSSGNPNYPSDTGLHAPPHSNGKAAEEGRILVCGQPSVSKAQPTLTTKPSAGGIVNSVVLNDTATLSGGSSPTGSITFFLWSPSQTTCSGTASYTQTVTVSGDGSYSTTNTTPANATGTWNWTAMYSGDSANLGASSSCGAEPVTVSAAPPPGSCEGSGSISALVSGSNVTAYVPKGNWFLQNADTGIDVVNVEGSSITNTQVPTGTDAINSCASNSVTGQTVCVSNGTDVYVLKGTGLDPSVSPNPLVDGGSGTITFSGGSATTTGVSMDATDNKALLGLSVGGVAGFQFLDLSTDTFEPAFTTKDPGGDISEDPLIDPVHHLIVSAAEDGNVELVNVSTTTSPTFYEQASGGGELDSSSEDCSTGIILAPAEFSNPSNVFIADLQKAVYTPGSPGSWTAPEQTQTLTGSSLDQGANASAVAQGTHTGAITGEFGGNSFTALALPTTSGTGATPAISNWVTCDIPNTPDGNAWSQGDDPHPLAAYQSPNGSHDAIALFVDEGANWMAAVDLTQTLNPSVVPVTANVCDSGTLPSSLVTFTALP